MRPLILSPHEIERIPTHPRPRGRPRPPAERRGDLLRIGNWLYRYVDGLWLPVWELAFPTIASTTGGQSGTTDTTIDCVLPATINAGDLLLIFLATDGAPTFTWPSGWDQAANNLFSQASGTAVKMEGKQRIADGSEDGATVTVTLSVGEAMAYVTMRITGWHGTTPAEAATAQNTTKPDPPSLNPTGWDVEDTLWLAAGCTDAGGADDDNITAVPTNYTLVDSLRNCGVDAGGCNLGVGSRNNAVAAEDPGQFTTNTNEDTCGATVAVRPAGAAPKSLAFAPDPFFAMIGR